MPHCHRWRAEKLPVMMQELVVVVLLLLLLLLLLMLPLLLLVLLPLMGAVEKMEMEVEVGVETEEVEVVRVVGLDTGITPHYRAWLGWRVTWFSSRPVLFME
jgi:hypothetical protein